MVNNQLPVGYVFMPRDEELIVYYLMKKINNEELPCTKIHDANVYEHNPEELHDMYYRATGEDVCYFFTQREKKHKGDNKRPNRTTKDGFWRASSGQKQIFHEQALVGCQRTLVYWKGKPGPEAQKTSWIMQEYYTVAAERQPPSRSADENDIKLDDWVLCKIYTATKGSKRNKETRNHPYARPTVSKEGSLHSNESESSSSNVAHSAQQFQNVHNSFSMDLIPSTTNDQNYLSIEDYGYTQDGLPAIGTVQQTTYSSDQWVLNSEDGSIQIGVPNWPEYRSSPIPTPTAIPPEQQDVAAQLPRWNSWEFEFLKDIDFSS